MKEVFTVEEMLELQQELHKAYEGEWDPLESDFACSYLLWMLGEAGEMIDVLKKEGTAAVCDDLEVRAHFVEETCDLLMYLMDTLLCLGISAEELGESFRRKQKRNLTRWK